MFSASVELLLNVAFREATARRHVHLTLEHLLYVLAHDTEGEKILAACGAELPKLRVDLDRYLQRNVEQYPRGQQREPDQTIAFQRSLQTAVLHVQSAGKGEVEAGDLLAALLQQSRSYAAQAARRAGRDTPRRAQLHLARRLEGAAAAGHGRGPGRGQPGARRRRRGGPRAPRATRSAPTPRA